MQIKAIFLNLILFIYHILFISIRNKIHYSSKTNARIQNIRFIEDHFLSPCKVYRSDEQNKSCKEELGKLTKASTSPSKYNKENDNSNWTKCASYKSIEWEVITNNNSVE